MKKIILSLIAVVAITFSALAPAWTINKAPLIGTNDPLVGTWVGMGISKWPSYENTPSKGWDQVVFVCYIWGNSDPWGTAPSGVCDGEGRSRHDGTKVVPNPAPWDIWVRRVGKWGTNVVVWTLSPNLPIDPLQVAVVNRGWDMMRTGPLVGTGIDGTIEDTTMFRVSDQLDMNQIDQFFGSIPDDTANY
jgi:hypothetical protein